MAYLAEEETYEEGIYQLELTDEVMGGVNGISNLQSKQLANRTKYLKSEIDRLETEKASISEIDRLETEKVAVNTKGQADGVATLDNQGRVPYSQLPESAMEFKGTWEADTNTPTLADGTGDVGDMYIVSVAGTVDLGSGDIQFFVNDRVIYDGSVWSRLSAGDVKTVNNVLPTNGNVTLTANDVNAVPSSAKGQANGIATLDENARVPYSQLPTDIMSFDDIYPIGSIYISVGDIMPAFGEWEKLGTGRTLWNDNTPDGREIEAGLPNITGVGWVDHSDFNRHSFSGAFSAYTNFNGQINGSDGGSSTGWRFNARNGETDTDGNIKTSGQVFGNSNTVQPPAIAVSMWKRTA